MTNNFSKLYIASDHRGVGVKLYLIEMLSAAGYNPINLGTDNPDIKIDFSDIAEDMANKMESDSLSRGILICATGGGMEIAANRFSHIRATRCFTPDQARSDRFHDDTNVIALAADDLDIEMAFLCVKAFLESPFDNQEYRIQRINKLSQIKNKH